MIIKEIFFLNNVIDKFLYIMKFKMIENIKSLIYFFLNVIDNKNKLDLYNFF